MRYNRGSLESTVTAAKDQAIRRGVPVYVSPTAYGWRIEYSDLAVFQEVYRVTADRIEHLAKYTRDVIKSQAI